MKRVRRNKANLVIKEHNPWKVFLWLVVAMVMISVGVALSFEIGKSQADFDSVKADSNIKDKQALIKLMSQRIKKLKRDLGLMRTQVARLESQNRIDGHAHRQIKRSLVRLQKENLDLREELDFYHNIVSPNKEFAGLKIHSFKIDQGTEKGLFYYKLTLIQVHGLKNRHRTVSGVINVYVIGKRHDGTTRILSLKDVAPASSRQLKFSIKYLRRFEGRMSLPAGFLPSKVRVRVIPKRRRRGRVTSIEKLIEWPFKTG